MAVAANDEKLERLRHNREKISCLIEEAESIRRNLSQCFGADKDKPPLVVEDISTNENTVISNIAQTCIDSPSRTDCDLFSPAASTIYLRSRIHPKHRSHNYGTVSVELQRILPSVSSSMHRKALMAIDRFGIDAVRYKKGFTALHWACKSGNTEVIRYLVAKGADLHQTDDNGKSPQDYADERDDPDASFLLHDLSGKDVRDRNMLALSRTVDLASLKEPHRKALEAIAKHGWSSLKWGGGWTILHWAYQNGRRDVIEFCKRLNVPFNIPDDKGKLPAHYACNSNF